MKSQTYMDRALRSRDPRYQAVLTKLGYARRDQVADASAPEPKDERGALRAAYVEAFGKKPYGGWDAETLRAKLAEKP